MKKAVIIETIFIILLFIGNLFLGFKVFDPHKDEKVKAAYKEELRSELKAELRNEIKNELTAEIKNEVTNEIKNEVTEETKKKYQKTKYTGDVEFVNGLGAEAKTEKVKLDTIENEITFAIVNNTAWGDKYKVNTSQKTRDTIKEIATEVKGFFTTSIDGKTELACTPEVTIRGTQGDKAFFAVTAKYTVYDQNNKEEVKDYEMYKMMVFNSNNELSLNEENQGNN